MATPTPTPTSLATETTSSLSSSSSSSSRYRYNDPYDTTTTPPPVAALTTQFQAPTHCFNDFHLASFSISYDKIESTRVTFLNANTTGIFSSECWPSGFLTTQFRPGVCPSGWTYYNIHTTHRSISITLADCCASGFTKTKLYDYEMRTGPLEGCFQSVEEGHTTIDGLMNRTATAQFTGGYLGHEPLRIQWNRTDAATLSPSPPQVTEDDRYIPTWVPGHKAELERSQNMEGGSETDQFEGLFKFLVIGLPLIVVTLIGCCFMCCVRHSRNKRRALAQKRDAEARANVAAVEATMAAEAQADAELAQAIEMIERQQAGEDAAPTTLTATTAAAASPPRYSVDDADDELPPTYQKNAPTT